MFTPLSRDEIGDIVKLQFAGIQKMLKDMGISLSATEEALEWLGELGYDPQFGARPLKRVIQKEILNQLSKDILAGKVNKEEDLLLRLDDHKQFCFEVKVG
jgi:ATP-dependent Clp protease ATP-binding subunit ClpB